MTNAKSKLISLSVLAALAAVVPLSISRAEDAPSAPDPAFKKFKLSDKFYSEGCTYSSCPFSESIPPPDPYAIRTPEWQPDEYNLTELKTFVTRLRPTARLGPDRPP